ncbi:MAG: hypothetical protein JXA67_18960 [Micromonosporaceae bacterium]|nr:hypothetical protein [Micromonosporaceae bacterium]
MSEQTSSHTVLVYSDDPKVREHMKLVIGERPAQTMRVTFVEAQTAAAVTRLVAAGGVDLVLLDGEASPAGGIGLARQLRDEVVGCPPTVVAIARAADRWLAAYAKADATLTHPLDPVLTSRTIANLLREHLPAPSPEASSQPSHESS